MSAEYNCPPPCPKCRRCHRGECDTGLTTDTPRTDLHILNFMKSCKEYPCIEYRITDRQIMRDMEDAYLPISAESSCATILERQVGCWRASSSTLMDVLIQARLYLKADAWEYHHSMQTGEHVFRFHLPNVQDQRAGCLAQAVPSTDCDKHGGSL